MSQPIILAYLPPEPRVSVNGELVPLMGKIVDSGATIESLMNELKLEHSGYNINLRIELESEKTNE